MVLKKLIKVIANIPNMIRWSLTSQKFRSIGTSSTIGKKWSVIGPQNISIGNNCRFDNNVKLQTWSSFHKKRMNFNPCLEIGDNVSLMDNCHLSCADLIHIGNGCLLGDNVFITDNYHGSINIDEMRIPPADRELYLGGQVHIGDNVWIGRNVCIMPGVAIGEGSIIGANAVVTHDIPQYCVAAGVPAKVIKVIG